MELQRRYAEIAAAGLGLVAISYDSPDTLKAFAGSRGITFPLIADPQSTIIRAYGILNDSEKPGTRGYGIPHPGTFIVDRNGIVVSRFFEDAYQERYSASTILSTLGAGARQATISARTAHLSLAAAISDAAATPGHRLTITVDVTPNRGIHVYAPGKHTYQVVRLGIDPQTWLRVHAPVYPVSEIYHFKPLDERVEVYMKPFRLRQDITFLATQDAQKTLATMPEAVISGALEYQACDDKVCFIPARVPIRLSIAVHSLDRKPAGGP